MSDENDSFEDEARSPREAYLEAIRRGAAWFIECADAFGPAEYEYVYVHDTEEFALYEMYHIVTRAAPHTACYSTLIPFEGQTGNISVWATTKEMREGTWKTR